MEQYSWRECIEIAGIPLSITNDLLEGHVLLKYTKIDVSIDELDTVICHRLGSIDRTIVKLLNRKDAVELLENKDKLEYVDSYENSSKEYHLIGFNIDDRG